MNPLIPAGEFIREIVDTAVVMGELFVEVRWKPSTTIWVDAKRIAGAELISPDDLLNYNVAFDFDWERSTSASLVIGNIRLVDKTRIAQ